MCKAHDAGPHKLDLVASKYLVGRKPGANWPEKEKYERN